MLRSFRYTNDAKVLQAAHLDVGQDQVQFAGVLVELALPPGRRHLFVQAGAAAGGVGAASCFPAAARRPGRAAAVVPCRVAGVAIALPPLGVTVTPGSAAGAAAFVLGGGWNESCTADASAAGWLLLQSQSLGTVVACSNT